MASRVYFYKDENGTVQKYEYCSLCMKGPYTQAERGQKYKVLGGKHSSVYCLECAKINRLGGLDIYTPVQDAPSVVIESMQPENASPVIVAPIPVVEPAPQPVAEKKPEPVAPVAKEPLKAKEDPADRQRYNAMLVQELTGKKPIPVKGPYMCYIGQCSDESYVCGVTKNITREAAAINNGGAPKNGKLPIEIIYYRAEKELSGAHIARSILSKYKREQKERLVAVFEGQLFGRD